MAFASPGPLLLLVTSLLAAPLAFDGMTEDPTAPAPPTDQPPLPPPDTTGPETALLKGSLTVPDPTGEFFGSEATLWQESCLKFPKAGPGNHATLRLLDGATKGNLEDLDLHFLDADGNELGALAGDSDGLGVHHAGPVPDSIAHYLVCLVDGSDAEFEVLIE